MRMCCGLYINDIIDGVKKALATVDPTPCAGAIGTAIAKAL